jgi:DNA-binding response OmpR family regulator
MAKILIIDDNEDLREFFSILLKKNGFETRTATSRTEIDSHLTLFNPDLILLDVLLGNEDGRDLCKEIKTINKNIKIILLSGNPQVLTNYYLYKADDRIEKPFEIQEILAKIRKMIPAAA